MNLLNVFSDREKAYIFWSCIFFMGLLIWALIHKSLRDNLKGPVVTILKILSSFKIGIPLLLMGTYVSLVVFLASTFRLWDVSMLKDTLLWFFGTACIMFGSTDKAGQDSKYFREVLLDNLQFSVLLVFIINLYTLNIFVELILVLILSLISAMLAAAGKKNEYAPARKALKVLLAIINLVLLSYALIHVFGDFQHFATIENAKTFLLPPVLTFAFLPFMYCLTLWARYETLFTSVDIWTRNKELANFIKWKLFSKCLLNLNKLNRVFKQCSVDLMAAKDKPGVTAIMQRFKNKPIAKPKEM